MTIAELLAMPKGISFEEYEKLLKDKQKLEKQIRRVSNIIFDEEWSLEVLRDEIGSERYNKHWEKKNKAEAKLANAKAELEQINNKLNG